MKKEATKWDSPFNRIIKENRGLIKYMAQQIWVHPQSVSSNIRKSRLSFNSKFKYYSVLVEMGLIKQSDYTPITLFTKDKQKSK